ncbi:MAG: glycosyltransferase family 2 protein [Lachnospiraceae bacterium]|nr:glycosyltransferase family 2 protein [Lachnospiraceae bacterium]
MNRVILSIVIPTKNRANMLKKVLESIMEQKADQEAFEVIVIDNGSTDETKVVAKEYKKKIKNYRYIYDARPGLHVGRNRGLLESQGDVIGYLDDDVILFPNWINTVLSAFEDESVMYVEGSVIPYDMSLLTQDFRDKHECRRGSWYFIQPISCFWERDITEDDMRVHKAPAGSFFGANSVYRKRVLHLCGGFHPDGMPNNLLMYRGDGETHVACYMLEHKMKAMYYAQASVYHMIDVNRISDSYIRYMYFRTGISGMYTSLRENSLRGGAVYFLSTLKGIMRSERTISEIRGELYLFLYYLFYKCVRDWIHKKDYF